MARALAVLNWFLALVLLGLTLLMIGHLPVALDPSESDPEDIYLAAFAAILWAAGAVTNYVVGFALWFPRPSLTRSAFWMAAGATGFVVLLMFITLPDLLARSQYLSTTMLLLPWFLTFLVSSIRLRRQMTLQTEEMATFH